MFEKLQATLLRLLRVPPQPDPPFGDPASVRVFRASRRFYFLRLVNWSIAQVFAFLGLLFWISVIAVSEHEAARVRSQPSGGMFSNLKPGQNQVTLEPLRRIPPVLFKGLWVLKAGALAIYVAQLLITYLAVRLDYQMRWYIVTDRSLRIRSGLWTVQEMTMSYANLQQVVLTQGPLERLLRIANVRVESAGGSSGGTEDSDKGHTMHNAVLQGVDNATEIRDLILERLRRFRDSGLGDPDDVAHPSIPAPASIDSGEEVLTAARELLDEARQVRAALRA